VKDIEMIRSHDFRAKAKVFVHYKAAQRYARVPEAAVRSILAAGAGKIVAENEPRPAKFLGEAA
jgi:hypothetical protein